MTYLLSLLAALLGTGLGFFAGAAAAAALAPLLGISSFEGASGYFAVFIGGPLGGLLGLVIGPVLVLRRRGHRGFSAIAGRLGLAVAGVVVLGALVLAVVWWMRPIVNPNGLPPQLVFEIRLPPGAAAPDSREGFLELQTSENRMPANSVKIGEDQGRPLVTGNVELYYRTSSRILVLTMPDKTDVLFTIRVGRSPVRIKTLGEWMAADYIAEPGKEQPRKATAGDRYEIRYRVDWPGDD
jgi:hypothetical protein